MIETVFDPKKLESYDSLKNYVEEGLESALQKASENSPLPNKSYSERAIWEKAQLLAKQQFFGTISAIFEVFSYLTKPLTTTLTYRKIHIFSRYLHGLSHKAQLAKNDAPLCFSSNHHKLFPTAIYSPRSRKVEELSDARLRQGLFTTDFYSEEGLCRGGVILFNTLVLRMMAQKKCTEKELIKIAKVFERGIPEQGALLQGCESLFLEQNLCGVRKTSAFGLLFSLRSWHAFLNGASHKHSNTHAIWGIGLLGYGFHLNAKTLEKAPQQIDHHFASLGDGVYELTLSEHAVSFIKFEGNEYLWNPNRGLYPISKGKVSGKIRPYLKGENTIAIEKVQLNDYTFADALFFIPRAAIYTLAFTALFSIHALFYPLKKLCR